MILGPVQWNNAFSIRFFKTENARSIRVQTIVFVAYSAVDTKALEDDNLAAVLHETARKS